MNVLIVNDQISVLKGLTSSVNFNNLGVDNVFTAVNVYEAKAIIKSSDINILLSDIEMPEENGLLLIKWVCEYFPTMIRIVLTSHASFRYAQESIKLGCFDYIVQPTPYSEIENVVLRAVSKIISDRHTSHYYNVEVLSNTVFNLFSSNTANKQQSIEILKQAGYALHEESKIQVIIIDANNHNKDTSIMSPDK